MDTSVEMIILFVGQLWFFFCVESFDDLFLAEICNVLFDNSNVMNKKNDEVY